MKAVGAGEAESRTGPIARPDGGSSLADGIRPGMNGGGGFVFNGGLSAGAAHAGSAT